MTEPNADALWSMFGSGPRGVLVTLKRDGRAQLSTVGYLYDAATRSLVISLTADRVKTRNLRRDPRASFQVSTPDLSAYAVAEGIAELSAVAAQPDDEVVERLVEHYRALQGEHPDWADFRVAMVHERRLLLTLPLTYVYGWQPGEA